MQLADLQLGLRQAHLAGHAQAAVVIGGLAILLHRQQAGVDPVGAAVQLDAEGADGVDAEAHRTWRVAGLEVEDEALGPFLGPGLLVRPDDVGEVAAEVVVAQLQGGGGILDEAGFGGHDGKGEGAQKYG
ncbi:hypothetical protein D3C84_828050 [compost metagenome]